ncbi:glycosyltransferase family 2 protein [Methanobrevibacter sp. TMH8]|uniref:glycosyltransferase family 2 protein n=1 Tax=Methanobrevibacter sp. TMH8 TaxID=2848611 RepID=UPI001CCEBAC6|nr:glycosyltransferase family 2 protein [Methanobrevibacter sp. TMH8]MBZ9570421.1 glycosyltransferase family 2 protein [Methanobrevibacter sp. TMH8]
MDLSIIIVNYKTHDLTKNTVNSVLKTVKSSYEIFIVDNDSQDGSYQKLESTFQNEISSGKIKLIANDSNQGFAAANNIAIRKSKGNFILLLNSDTIVKKGSIDIPLEYIKHNNDIGAIGPKILLPNGDLDKAAKRSFPNPKNSFYRLFGLSKISKNSNSDNYNLDNLDPDEVYEVDSLVGAFMLVRNETIIEIGLLDEDYFMYGEDIDWCYRIKKAGWKVIYYGKVDIIHYKGSSSKKQKSKLIYEFHRAMYLFYKKHYTDKYSLFTKIIVYIGITLLLIIKLFLNIFKK